jgi:hypothetical protein
VPLPKIVIDVDHRNICVRGTLLQQCQAWGYRQSAAENLFSIGKFEMINYIDEQYCDPHSANIILGHLGNSLLDQHSDFRARPTAIT